MLRPATPDDLPEIRRWRNHPQVRSSSLTQHEITEDEHQRWWSLVSADETRSVLIYEKDGVPAGVVAFNDIADGEQRSAMWGFYLDLDGLEERGELLPAWLQVMREAVAYAFDELKLDVLRGEVLESNAAVRQMNRRYGFVETSSEMRTVDGGEQEVFTIELAAKDRRLK